MPKEQPPNSNVPNDGVPQYSPPPSDEPPEHTATTEEVREELNQAIEGSQDVLAIVNTVSPIFPDTITVDRAKLTITQRKFFATGDVMSIRIEDILNATATLGPFFGTVKIVSRVMSGEKPYVTNLMWRNDAVHLKRIIQGYIIALQRQIDCSKLPTNELVAKLDKLGEDDHPENTSGL